MYKYLIMKNFIVSILMLVCAIVIPGLSQDAIPVIPQDQIPKAVSLKDLQDKRAKEAGIIKVKNNGISVTAKNNAKLNIMETFVPTTVYTGTLDAEETTVFFIQLAALFNSRGSADQFRRLGVFGNIYKQYAGNAIKIKLGYFENKIEASDILRQVKAMGYRDAFITRNQMNASDIELMMTGSYYIKDDYAAGNANFTSSTATYKVQLASYQDPMWFPNASIDDLGKIEQWTKGEWTIFVLSAYSSYDKALEIRDLAIARGFNEAKVVLDNNGILELVN